MNVFNDNKYKAVLLDMDGVFVETEMLHYHAFYELLRPLGIEITVEYFYRLIGEPISKNFIDITRDFDLKVDIEEWKKRLSDQILETLTNEKIIPIEGIINIIEFARNRGMKLGLVTTSSRHQFDIVIHNVKKNSTHPLLKDHIFDVIITGEDVKNKKPSPDPYLVAASSLGMAPFECIVIEDSEAGIISAKSAGCFCIARRAVYNSHMNFSMADLIVSSILCISQDLTIESSS